MKVAGIDYIKPKIYLLQESGLGTSEFAARTAYNSFNNSENQSIQELNDLVNGKYNNNFGNDIMLKNSLKDISDIEHSDLLDQL